jgi:hypothetical protein
MTCDNCECETDRFPDCEDVVAAWNTRTPDLTEELRLAKATLDRCSGVDYEKAFKMLLAANYMGVRLSTSDGHWWIEALNFKNDPIDGDIPWIDHDAYFDKLLIDNSVTCREKVYDGPLQALIRIDAAMKACDNNGLLEGVFTEDWYMGDFTESNEGIAKDGKDIE